MNAINATKDVSQGAASRDGIAASAPAGGDAVTIGSGFNARSFRAAAMWEAMDPLVMVDHYVMTEPAFGAHPHAGMSAVSLLFEDSEGLFHNRDSLGNDFDLRPGDLYWLSAGSGAVHDESPRENARIHGLQVFVNVPQSRRFASPDSLLVRATDMPVIDSADSRVKIALGESNGVRGAESPSTPMSILDGTIRPGGHVFHETTANRGIWVQAIRGGLDVCVGETTRRLTRGQAVAMKVDGSATVSVSNVSRDSVHFVLFDGAQVGEPYVQDGPFVMGSQEQIAAIKADYAAGRLGSIPALT